MSRKTVLVVEDEEDIRELVTYNLETEGYRVIGVATGEEAITAVGNQLPDMILLDLMLPGTNGLDVCRMLKGNSETQGIPVIMVTAKGEESDIVVGLELGADDYVVKPFSPKELTARMRAVLRRTQTAPVDDSTELRIRDLVIRPGRHEVIIHGTPLNLTVTEFRLLHLLARRPGWVFTRYQIVDALHGSDYPVTDRSIDVQIAGLRKKLGKAGTYIETVRGVGYRFKD